jgi:hypothetical protein
MNAITGFLRDGSDLVLFGRKDPNLPGIELDTLAVALRSGYRAGDAYQGVPGCSIDPIPGADPFRIQQVSTFGVPRECLFSARNVSLDYELKRAGAGIPGEDGKILPSAFELADRDGPCAVSDERAITMSHRFWFFPKVPVAPRFQRDRQTVSVLKPVDVQLLTEREFLNRRGERTGAAEADPTAQQFADAVTGLLASGKVERFSRMVSDFRVLEVGKLIRFSGVPEESIAFLLRDFEIASVTVPELVGGVERDEVGHTVCQANVVKTSAGIQYEARVSRCRYEYRGGVEARVEVSEGDLAQGSLEPLRRRVLQARPSPDSVWWQVA